jgi:hypothetical protein
VEVALFVCPLGDQRGTSVHHADEVHADVRRIRAGVLLEEHELLGDGRAAPSVISRPREPGVSRVVELALPTGVVLAPCGPIAVVRRIAVAWNLAFEPRADLGPERFVLV